jgi:alpha-ribazole phosphatase
MTPKDAPAILDDAAGLDRLSRFLPADAPVISSPLRRAVMTADAIAGPRLRLGADPGLAEFDHGRWEGLGWQTIADGWPDLSRRYWEDPGDAAPPGGESWTTGAVRMRAATARLVARPEPDLIAVAHHGVILVALAEALRAAPRSVLSQEIRPLSVTVIALDGDRRLVEKVNHRA